MKAEKLRIISYPVMHRDFFNKDVDKFRTRTDIEIVEENIEGSVNLCYTAWYNEKKYEEKAEKLAKGKAKSK